MSMISTRRSRWLGAAVLAIASLAAPVSAQTPTGTIVIPVAATRQLPLYVAEDRGFWRDAGYDLKVSVVRGVAATNAVISGNADFAYTGSLAMLRAAANGQILLAISQMQNALSHQVVLRADVAQRLAAAAGGDPIARAKALAGLTFAVDTLDGQPHGYLKYALGRSGLNPDKDVTVTPVQPPSMVAALQTRAVDGFVFSKPWTDLAVTQVSAKMWLDSEKDALEIQPFAAGVVVTKPDTCEKRPAVCKAVVVGLQKAVDFIRADRNGAKAILAKRFAELDPATLDDAVVDSLYSVGQNLRVSADALKNVQSFLVTSGLLPANARVDLEKLYSNQYAP